jgi:Fe-S cluster biosynthesis and repair protein YggX
MIINKEIVNGWNEHQHGERQLSTMIINKRKLALLDTMRKDLYTKAQQDGEIKLYYTKK